MINDLAPPPTIVDQVLAPRRALNLDTEGDDRDAASATTDQA